MGADAEKICTKCGSSKPLSAFSSHHTTRDRLRPDCKACKVAANKIWARKNPDRRAASTKRSRAKNPDVFRDRKRKDYAKFAEKRRATLRKWRDENREKVRETNRLWQSKNKDRYLLSIRLCNERRRGKGPLTKTMVQAMMTSQRGTCPVCRVKLVKFHIDHIMPIARGGDNAPENLQLLCPPCNQQKKDRDPMEFMRSRGFLL